MPIYEYRCDKCGAITEKLFPVEKRNQEVECECGGKAHNVIAKPARFQRGNGWASRMDGPIPGRM